MMIMEMHEGRLITGPFSVATSGTVVCKCLTTEGTAVSGGASRWLKVKEVVVKENSDVAEFADERSQNVPSMVFERRARCGWNGGPRGE
jgi:hypothetical protein